MRPEYEHILREAVKSQGVVVRTNNPALLRNVLIELRTSLGEDALAPLTFHINPKNPRELFVVNPALQAELEPTAPSILFEEL